MEKHSAFTGSGAINGYDKWIINERTTASKGAFARPDDEHQSSQEHCIEKKKNTWRKTAKDRQLGQHTHTQTQENKEVYRPARWDGRPTVPERTEAHCGGPSIAAFTV